MRPVVRGQVPEAGGIPRVYAKYGHARDDLIKRLGAYCSYCEAHIPIGSAVEHVQPKQGKAGHPELELVWDNFLLGCVHCNSTKGYKPVVLSDLFWPDRDNTFRAFKYEVDRAPQVADGLTSPQRDMAESTLQLTGLDREPGHPKLRKDDRRWVIRNEVWGIARDSFDNLQKKDCEEMRQEIVKNAQGRGFWSVWMTVFAKDRDMIRRFIASFKGTAKDCFNAKMNPVPRPGGQL
jgi:hypothetical protein